MLIDVPKPPAHSILALSLQFASSCAQPLDRTKPASKQFFQVKMSKNSSVDADSPTKSECLELFRALKNKDELSRSCKEIMQMITANDKGVMENEALNTHGGSRTRGGISHAALQRRFTGKMSGVSLG